MKQPRIKPLLLITICSFCTGCASAVNQHHALQLQLDMPVDCEKAEAQIASLQQEQIGGGEKLLNGIASILPTSAVINLISGEYSSRWQIANGSFNKQADERIAKIEKECEEKKNSDTVQEQQKTQGDVDLDVLI